MEYANDIRGFINAFRLSPLEIDELDRFYCDKTMRIRTGSVYKSPILDIYESCKEPSITGNVFLLLSHYGSGKSTELNNMSSILASDGYHVYTVRCAIDMDLINPVFTDLLVLMGDALLKVAEATGCDINKRLKQQLMSFWSTEISQIITKDEFSAMSSEAGLQAETPSFLSGLLKAFVRIKADIKYSSDKRMECKTKMTPRTSEWLGIVNSIAEKITDHLGGKQPIIIFEDLDKITNSTAAWDIFSDNAATLTDVSFPLIYTFPIALFYDPRFASLKGYYVHKMLPMIKLETVDGKIYQPGIDVVINIVSKRANLSLFDIDVLETLIKKTGGSLRDLFSCILGAARIALRKQSKSIAIEDANIALADLKSSLTRRIEKKQYAFLADIYNGNRIEIADKPMLLEMLQAEAVLEYNTDRWHNIHPLVADFLKDIGEIKIK
jgi:hypothetical protein